MTDDLVYSIVGSITMAVSIAYCIIINTSLLHGIDNWREDGRQVVFGLLVGGDECGLDMANTCIGVSCPPIWRANSAHFVNWVASELLLPMLVVVAVAAPYAALLSSSSP